MLVGPEEVLSFWLDEVGPAGWYRQDDALDDEIRRRFEATYDKCMQGSLSLWLTYASGTLAYIILTDQFPRNMFRGSGKAFKSDPIARAAAKQAIARGWDQQIDGLARQFFYLPLMHAECLSDQERAVRLIKDRMPDDGGENLLHARAHREVIRRFGRFPHRNDDLGRATQDVELGYLENGGYGRIVRELKADAA